MAATGDTGHSGQGPSRRAGGHHSTVSDILGDLPRGCPGPTRRDQGSRGAGHIVRLTIPKPHHSDLARESTLKMNPTTSRAPLNRPEPELLGQTVVVIGGSAGIGLETARRAREEGADVILTGRNPERLSQAAATVGAQRTAAFDATDAAALHDFFEDLSAPIDHVLVTAGGPRYVPLLEMSSADVREALGA